MSSSILLLCWVTRTAENNFDTFAIFPLRSRCTPVSFPVSLFWFGAGDFWNAPSLNCSDKIGCFSPVSTSVTSESSEDIDSFLEDKE